MFRLKKYKKELLLLIMMLFLFFFICEAIERIYLFGFGGGFGSDSCKITNAFSPHLSISPIGRSGLIQASDNCEIVYEFKPNIKNGYYKLHKFETNSQGLRDKEYSIEKPPGVYRVAVLGDSFTMPFGVDIENAYHSILEERFKSEGYNYEFINFAVDGYCADQYLATLKYKAIEYNPDLVLVGFFVANDIPATDDVYYMCNYTVQKKENDFLKSYFFNKIIRNKVTNIYNKFKKEKNEESVISDFDNKRMDNFLNGLKNFSYENKIPIIFVLLPPLDKNGHSNRFHPLLIDNLCKIPGFFVIDILPTIDKQYKEYLKMNGYTERDKDSFFNQLHACANDTHPNEKAHKLFAGIIYEKIKEYMSHPNDRYEICISQKKEYDNTTINLQNWNQF